MWWTAFFVVLAIGMVCQFQIFKIFIGIVVPHFNAWAAGSIVCGFLLLFLGMHT